MKTVNTYPTLNKALKAVLSYGSAYATIANCYFIKTDNEIDCNAIRRDFGTFKLKGMLNKKNGFFSDSHPYTYYMVIREKGQEGSTDKAHVIERVKHFGGALAAVDLTYNGIKYTVTLETN